MIKSPSKDATPTIAAFSRGVSGGVLELAREANREGCKVVLFTTSDAEERMKATGLFDEIVGLSRERMSDRAELVRSFSEKRQERRIDAAVCCYDPLGPAVCDIMEHCYGAGPEAGRLRRAYVKSIVRRELAEKGIDDLLFFELKGPDDVEALKGKVAFSREDRWILKPSFGTASEFVSPPLESYDALEEYYERASKEAGRYSKEIRIDGTDYSDLFLLERYVEGEEYSVEGICVGDAPLLAGVVQKQGLTIINGIRSEGVNFAPIDDPSRREPLLALAKAAAGGMALSNTAFHIEMRWDRRSARPRIIEINPRLPGGLLCNIHKDRHGVSLPKLLLDIKLGLKVSESGPTVDPRYYGDLPLPTAAAGIYRGVSLPKDFKERCAESGDIEIVDFLPHGEAVDPSRSEVYFAHAYISSETRDRFWSGVKLCEAVTAIVEGAGGNRHP